MTACPAEYQAALAAARDRVKPGSRSSLLLDELAARIAATGEPVLTTTLVEALQARTDCPRVLAMADLHSMVRRGVLERVDGRPGYTRVAPAGSGFVPVPRADDDAMTVLAALRRAYAMAKRPVPTRDVARQLTREGTLLRAVGPNVVRKRLESLARPRQRGSHASRGPLVARAVAPTRDRIAAAFWVPIEHARGMDHIGLGPGGEYLVEAEAFAYRSRAQAVRHAVSEASRALGRPASRHEIRWCMLTRAEPSIIRGVYRALAIVERTDEAKAPGRIATLRTRYTVHGGAPVRYYLRGPQPLPAHYADLSTLEDTILQLAVADEVEGIEALERRSVAQRSPTLRWLADRRREVLLGALRAAVGQTPVPEASDALRRTLRILTGWRAALATAPGMTAGQREHAARGLDHVRRHLAAARAILGLTVTPSVAAPRVERTLIVGEFGNVPLEKLRPYLSQVARRMGVEPERLRLGGCRRFPPAQPSIHTPLGQAERVVADVDRVDVLTALAETLEAPRSRSLLQAGALVLGRVLRDPVVLAQAFQRCAPHELYARRALLVALGLVGVVPPHAGLLGDEADGRALVTALAVSGDPASSDLLDGIARDRMPLAVMAARRLRTGFPLTAGE
jgi:hypothetical protein